MKKLTIVLVAIAFAATGLSAKKMSDAEKACRKTANETLKNAESAHRDAVKGCKSKKGAEKKECVKGAKETMQAARKAHKESLASCKTAAAAPAPAAQ